MLSLSYVSSQLELRIALKSDILDRIAALPAEKRAVLLRQLEEQRTQADAAFDLYDLVISAAWPG